MLDTLVYELRVGFRRLARDPLRSGISVVALTLGIGLTASMFSIAYSVLFRATPFDGEDRLFRVERLHPETGRRVASMPFLDYRDLSEEQSTLSALGAFAGGGVDLADGDAPPERIRASRFSPSFLRLLQVSPRLGRGFGPDDIGPHARVALISDRLWRDRFGGDPGMVVRSVRLNGDSHTVIGVMEPGFHFPGNQDLWLPLPFDPTSVGRNQGFVQVMARLPENADENVARAELETILAQLTREFGEGAAPSRVVLVPLVQSFLGEDDVALLWAMMIGSLLVLAIACVNVTNLLTAVAADRTGDLAVCTVLGASRRRVVSQLLMDAALLSLTGGVLGVLVANGFVRWFDRVLIGRKPVWLVMEVDTPILLFTLGVSMLAAILAGLTPAVRSARISVREILQDESRGASSRGLGKLSHAMVVATMALAYPLLMAAGLLIASFGAWNRNLPFDSDNVLVAQLAMPARYFPTAETRTAFIEEFVAWAEGQPGVRSVAFADVVPALGVGVGPVEIEGEQYLRDQDYPRARLAVVRPGFFGTMGVQPSVGRTFDQRDRTGPPALVVNAPFVARHFPDADPMGRRIRVRGEDEPWRTIVGVVPDLRMNGTDRETPEGLYVTAPPVDPRFGYFLVRTESNPAATAPLVRRGIAEIAPDVPIRMLETLDGSVEQAFWVIQVVGPIFTAFGFAALFLASVGLFGVVAHSVSRRTREIGVRMALGATGKSVVVTMARRGLFRAVLGVVLGSGLAIFGSRLLAGALFGVRPGDPVTMVVVGVVLLASALLATVVPALKAIRLSPVEALRGS
jgi:predicted permease